MCYRSESIQTFLCSEAVLGLSGVVFMLAGVAATGEDEFFSMISAGIFTGKYPLRFVYKRNPPVSSTRVNAVGRYSSRYEWISARSVPSSTGAAMMSQSLISPFASGRSNCLPQLRVGLIYISDCTRTARVKLPKLSFPQ